MTATTESPADLSPIAQCLRIAAQRGRALRLQREQAQHDADEQPRRDDAQAQPDQARQDAKATEAQA